MSIVNTLTDIINFVQPPQSFGRLHKFGGDNHQILFNKYKKAQQLLEFALALPIIIIFLLILAEIAMGLYGKVVFADAIRMSIMQVNQAYSYGGTNDEKRDSIRQLITKKIYDYLESQNMPYSGSVNVSINKVAGSDNSIVNATYNYHPFFSWGNFLPDKFQFSSSQLVNDVLLRSSNFNTFTTTNNINGFNSANKSSSILSFRYVYYDSAPPVSLDARKMVGFLVGSDSSNNYANLFNWKGQNLLPSALKVNLLTGYLSIEAPLAGGGRVDTTIPYSWLLAQLDISQAIYVPYNTMAFAPSFSDDISGQYLLNNAAMSLTSPYSSNTALGSFDPLNSGTYDKVYNYSINFNDNFILKLYLGQNSLPLGLRNKSYTSRVPVLRNGQQFYTDMSNIYTDTDSNGIPNAWDTDPQYVSSSPGGGSSLGKSTELNLLLQGPFNLRYKIN